MLFCKLSLQDCPSGEDNIHATCVFGCNCGCGDNNATFLACVSICEARIGGPLGCSALATTGGGDVPNEQCALTSYNKNAVCARTCDCCDIPTDECSCANALASTVFSNACALT